MSLQTDAPCWCSTTTVDSAAGAVVVVCVTGEVDLGTVGIVEAALATALARRPVRLVVDVAGMTFCSCRGFGVFLDCSTAAAGQRTGYALSGTSRHADRIWAMLWPEGLLPARYPSSGDALVAALAASTTG